MARLRNLIHTQYRCSVTEERVDWYVAAGRLPIEGLPQIIWTNGEAWREVNLWALQRSTENGLSLDTVRSNMSSMLSYANWLEVTRTKWWEFPQRKADRCLFRYRGYLIAMRDEGQLAPSTASQRMRDVINFYRWLLASELLLSEWPLWTDQTISIRVPNSVGLERTIIVQSSELSIKNRKANALRLEGGLLPVSADDRDIILEYAAEHASWELYLLLTLGFYTGMRLGTLCDLKVSSLERAFIDPDQSGLYKIAVGPGASPSVATKFGVTGHVWIVKEHLNLIRGYVISPRRQARVQAADDKNKELVFLTRFGNKYTKLKKERSSAINVEMHSLRKKAISAGLVVFEGFYFHQTRCTFATQLARILLPISGAVNAIAIIKEALLHKNEATSLQYIKFVEQSAAKAASANEFTRKFLGLGDKCKNG